MASPVSVSEVLLAGLPSSSKKTKAKDPAIHTTLFNIFQKAATEPSSNERDTSDVVKINGASKLDKKKKSDKATDASSTKKRKSSKEDEEVVNEEKEDEDDEEKEEGEEEEEEEEEQEEEEERVEGEGEEEEEDDDQTRKDTEREIFIGNLPIKVGVKKLTKVILCLFILFLYVITLHAFPVTSSPLLLFFSASNLNSLLSLVLLYSSLSSIATLPPASMHSRHAYLHMHTAVESQVQAIRADCIRAVSLPAGRQPQS